MNFLGAILNHLSSLQIGAVRNTHEVAILSRNHIGAILGIISRNDNKLFSLFHLMLNLRINIIGVPSNIKVLAIPFDNNGIPELEW